MKLIKLGFIFGLFFSLNSIFAEAVNKQQIMNYYQQAEIPTGSRKDLEKYTVKGDDSIEECYKKIFSARKIFNKYRKKNHANAFSWYQIVEKNVRKSYNLYPKDKNLKFLASVMYSKGFNFAHLEDCIYLTQENKAIPELNIAVYYFFYNYFENLQLKSDANYQKENFAIEFEIIFGKMNRKQFTKKLLLLKNYWQNLIDEEYAVKTGMSWLIKDKKQQTLKEKNEARKLWKNIIEYMVKYDYYSKYMDTLRRLSETKKVK